LEEIGEELKELCIWFPFFCHFLYFFYLSLSLCFLQYNLFFFFWETSNLVPDVYNNYQLGPKAIERVFGFGSVVVVAFQNTFHSEKCANNILFIFLNYFWDQRIKMIWKHQKHITSKQKKKSNSFGSAFEKHSQTGTELCSVIISTLKRPK